MRKFRLQNQSSTTAKPTNKCIRMYYGQNYPPQLIHVKKPMHADCTDEISTGTDVQLKKISFVLQPWATKPESFPYSVQFNCSGRKQQRCKLQLHYLLYYRYWLNHTVLRLLCWWEHATNAGKELIIMYILQNRKWFMPAWDKWTQWNCEILCPKKWNSNNQKSKDQKSRSRLSHIFNHLFKSCGVFW